MREDEITRKNNAKHNNNISNDLKLFKEINWNEKIRSHLWSASLGRLEWTANIWKKHLSEIQTELKSTICDWFGRLVRQCNMIGLFDLFSFSICRTLWTTRGTVVLCDSFPWNLNRISRENKFWSGMWQCVAVHSETIKEKKWPILFLGLLKTWCA